MLRWCVILFDYTQLSDRQSGLPLCERAASSRCPSCARSNVSLRRRVLHNPPQRSKVRCRLKKSLLQTVKPPHSWNSNRVKVSLATLLKTSVVSLWLTVWLKPKSYEMWQKFTKQQELWCKCGYHLTLHVLASKWLLGESWLWLWLTPHHTTLISTF